jgi:hypothetical protein
MIDLVIRKQKKKRRLKKVSMGEGIDLFIHVCAVKNTKQKKKMCTARKKKKKEGLMSPFP